MFEESTRYWVGLTVCRRVCALAVLLSLVIANLLVSDFAAKAATLEVAKFSGGILSGDVTLRASESPYLITSTIQVPLGVTLTAEPGVIIKSEMSGALFWVLGTVSLVGTPDRPVNIDSTGDIFFLKYAKQAIVDLKFCRVDGHNRASLLPGSGYEQYASINISDCDLVNMTTSYIWYPNSLSLHANVFKGSGTLLLGFYGPKDVQITNNLFLGSSGGSAWLDVWADYWGTLHVNQNTFSGAPSIAILSGHISDPIDATSNYWGSQDPAVIGEKVLDARDSWDYGPPVVIDNPLSAPAIATPSDLHWPRLTPLSYTPTPTVSGSFLAGEVLTADPGVWDTDALLTFQWLCDGIPIAGATRRTYDVLKKDEAHTISVSVSGSRFELLPVIKTSASVAVLKQFDQIGTPTIVGAFKSGATLEALPGTWDSNASLSYQWLRDSQPINGATSRSYALGFFDVGTHISVAVSASAEGFKAVTNVSDEKFVTQEFLFSGAPSINGEPTVGSLLTASAGFWDTRASLTFQWLRDGQQIDGATSSTYSLSASDIGKAVSVAVVGSAVGFRDIQKTSASVAVLKEFDQIGTPTIVGAFKSGATLEALPGTWDSNASLSYQWLRDSQPINGATSKTYKIVTADIGSHIALLITGFSPGYRSEARQSEASLTLNRLLQVNATISGTTRVGSKLTASVSTGSPNCKWFLQGNQEVQAKGLTLSLVPKFVGKSVFVECEVGKQGYASEVVSSGTLQVTQGILPRPALKLTGKFRPKSIVSVSTFRPLSKTTFSYEWLLDRKKLAGANRAKIQVTTKMLGHKLSARVTESSEGYLTRTTSSAEFIVSR